MLTQEKAQVGIPQVWNKATASAQIGDIIRIPFTSVMLVEDRDVLENGQVWLLVKPSTGSYSEEWVLEPEDSVETQQPAVEPQPQSAELAGDLLTYQLQPTQSAKTEFEQGCLHGQQDAGARLHPIYTKATCDYATGYVEGYNKVLNSTQPEQQQQDTKKVEWSVIYDSKWDWYQVWVGNRCCREKGASYEEGERIAQRYIATNELIKRQNAKVLAAYAC